MKNGMYEEGSVDKNSVGILCCRFNLCVGITSVEKNSCRNNLCREMFCRKKFCRYLFCREKLLAPSMAPYKEKNSLKILNLYGTFDKGKNETMLSTLWPVFIYGKMLYKIYS